MRHSPFIIEMESYTQICECTTEKVGGKDKADLINIRDLPEGLSQTLTKQV